MSIKEIKKSALQRLSENSGQGIAVCVIIISVMLVFALLNQLFYEVFDYFGILITYRGLFKYHDTYVLMCALCRVAQYILTVPAIVGAMWWFIHCVRGEQNPVSSILVAYSNRRMFFKTVWLKFNIHLRKLGITAIAALSIYAQYRVVADAFKGGGNNLVAVLLLFGMITLAVCMAAYWAVFTLRYTLVDYIFTLNPDLSVREIAEYSKEGMKNHMGDILRLIVSFIPQFLLCLLIFPVIFVVPYFFMARAELSNRIIEESVGRNAELFESTRR